MELSELQHAFMYAVREGQIPDLLRTHVKATVALSSQQRIAIYQDSLKGNLIACLKAAYPVCLRLVGEEYFVALAKRYINTHHHQQPSLACYGDKFSDFLRHFEPVHRILPYLSEVARLEWAYHLAFDSPEYKVLESEALSQLSEEQHGQVVFMLPPASTLIYSDFPIYAIWEINQPECEIQTEIDLQSGSDRLFIFRHDWLIHIHCLNSNEFEMLTHIQRGLCFADVCEQLLSQDPAINIAQIFAHCIRQKWLSDFRLP